MRNKIIAIHGVITMAHLKGLFTRFPERFKGDNPKEKFDESMGFYINQMDEAKISRAKQNTALQFVNEVNEQQKVWESLYKASFDAIACAINNDLSFSEIVKRIHNRNL